MVREEMTAWASLRNKNLLMPVGISYEDPRGYSTWQYGHYGQHELTLLTPLMTNGNVVDFLAKNPQVHCAHLVSLPLILHTESKLIDPQLLDAIEGLSFLHSQAIAHGDIKAVR